MVKTKTDKVSLVLHTGRTKKDTVTEKTKINKTVSSLESMKARSDGQSGT